MDTFLNAILGDRPYKRLAPYIYAALIVGLFLHPHLSAHIAPLWRPYVEGVTNLAIVGLGVLVYSMYTREQREFERRFLETSTYIGTMNRRLPILQQITTDLLSGDIKTRKQIRGVFQNLVAIAAKTIANSDRGLMRFVEISTGRTVREFWFNLGGTQPGTSLVVGNKELLVYAASVDRTSAISAMRLVLVASDRSAAVRAFLVIPGVRKGVGNDIPILQSIVDQGQLLAHYLYGNIQKQRLLE